MQKAEGRGNAENKTQGLHSSFALPSVFRLPTSVLQWPDACPLERGFNRESNVKVQDVMTRDPRTITPESTTREAAQLMKEEGVGILPVVEGAKLIGVLTDRDIAIRIVAEGRNVDAKVRDVMSTKRLATCRPDEDVDVVMETMANEQVRRVPIVDERGSLVGIVAQADIVRKAGDDRKAERTVERISEPGGDHSQ